MNMKFFSLRRCVSIGSGALASICILAAVADACGFGGGSFPPGSYRLTCNKTGHPENDDDLNCTIAGSILTCICETEQHNPQTFAQSSLDVSNCGSEPANINGQLKCDTKCNSVGAC